MAAFAFCPRDAFWPYELKLWFTFHIADLSSISSACVQNCRRQQRLASTAAPSRCEAQAVSAVMGNGRGSGSGRSEREKMVAGDGYNCMDSELVGMRAACKMREREYSTDVGYSSDMRKKHEFMAGWFGSVGKNCIVEPPVRCDYGVNVTVGDNFYCNFDAVFLDCAPIVIGDNVLIGPGVHVYTATHPLAVAERRTGIEMAKPVTIGSDVWIGGRSIILPGVVIGEGVTIGAGSVVTKSIPPHCLAVGNPARVMRELMRES
jgi:maltose O-acetyltransferase